MKHEFALRSDFVRRAWSARRAFTLIELVVSIVVGSIISGSAGMLLWNAASQRGDISARGELCDEGAMAMEIMARYLREIQQDNTCAPNFCPTGNALISTAAAAQINFGNTGLRYTSGSGMVEMTTNNGTNWRPLVKDVFNFTFAYFDRFGASLTPLPLSSTDCACVRRVRLTLELARGTQTVKLQTSLYLRNFMNEVAIP